MNEKILSSHSERKVSQVFPCQRNGFAIHAPQKGKEVYILTQLRLMLHFSDVFFLTHSQRFVFKRISEFFQHKGRM